MTSFVFSAHQEEIQTGYVLPLLLNAVDDDLEVEHLPEPHEDPGQVGDDEQGDDGDGDVRHVDLPRVPVGPALVEQQDALADADVEDDEDGDGEDAGSEQGVDLK